jgi:hypothetical protein
MAVVAKRSCASALLLCVVALGLATLPGSSRAASSAVHASYRQAAVIPIAVPGGPLLGDIIFADQRSGLVFFSDDANGTVDVINGRRDRLIAQVKGFVNGGPNGVLVDNRGQAWAADGDGSVRVFQANAPFHKIARIKVGPSADELGFDATHDLIAVTSPDPSGHGKFTPYLSLIDAKSHHVLGRVRVPAPAGSLEQPQWDPAAGEFIESIRHTPSMPGGALAVIDPVRRQLVKMIALTGCHAAGLAVGPGGQALVGCGLGGPMIVDPVTGRVLVRYPHRLECCADEVGYDALSGRYVVAEGGSDGPPPAPTLKPPAVLVIDAASHKLLSAIHLGNNAGPFHQAAMLGAAGKLFVPEGDGIHVFRWTGA